MNTATTSTIVLPHELQEYIKGQQRTTIEANLCEHSTTSQSELDQIASRAAHLYTVGQELIKQIQAQDEKNLTWCMKLYLQTSAYGEHELVEATILEKRVLVPRFVSLFEKMRKLHAVFF